MKPMDSSSLIAQALEILPVAVIVIDRDGRIALANPRAEALLSVAPGSRGRLFADALPHPVAAAIEGMIGELAATGRAPDRPLAPGAVGGLDAPLAVALAALADGGGFVATIREWPAPPEAAASPAQLTSKMGHDLKTPLTSIKAYTEALTEMSSDPQVRQFLKVIDEETDRLVAMINDLVGKWRRAN